MVSKALLVYDNHSQLTIDPLAELPHFTNNTTLAGHIQPMQLLKGTKKFIQVVPGVQCI